jgi:hypothetical protein
MPSSKARREPYELRPMGLVLFVPCRGRNENRSRQRTPGELVVTCSEPGAPPCTQAASCAATLLW